MKKLIKKIILLAFIPISGFWSLNADGINLGIFIAGKSDNGAMFQDLKRSLGGLDCGALLLDQVAFHNLLKFKALKSEADCGNRGFTFIFRDRGRDDHKRFWREHQRINLTKSNWVLFRSKTGTVFYLLVPIGYFPKVQDHFDLSKFEAVERLPKRDDADEYKLFLESEEVAILGCQQELVGRAADEAAARQDAMLGRIRDKIAGLEDLRSEKEKKLFAKLKLWGGRSEDEGGLGMKGVQLRLLKLLEVQWMEEIRALEKELDDLNSEIELLKKGRKIRDEAGVGPGVIRAVMSAFYDLQVMLCSLFREGSGPWNIVMAGHGSRGVDSSAGRAHVNKFYRHTICGFTLDQFREWIKFLNSKVLTRVFVYSCCYAGGRNFEDICSGVEHEFPVVVASTGDRFSYSSEYDLQKFFGVLAGTEEGYAQEDIARALQALNIWDHSCLKSLWHNIPKVRMSTDAHVFTVRPSEGTPGINVISRSGETPVVMENARMVILGLPVLPALDIHWNAQPSSNGHTIFIANGAKITIIEKLKLSFTYDVLEASLRLRNILKEQDHLAKRKTLLVEFKRQLRGFIRKSFYSFLNRGKSLFIKDIEFVMPEFTLGLQDVLCAACEHCDANEKASCEHKSEHINVGDVRLRSSGAGEYILHRAYY